MKRQAAIIALILAVVPIGLQAGDNDFRVYARPSILVPVGPSLSDGTPWYSIGGGGTIGVEYDIPRIPFLIANATVDADYVPIRNGNGAALLSVYAGGGLGARFALVPRLDLVVSAGGGVTYSIQGDAKGTLPFFDVGTGIDFRLTPGLSLGLTGSFKQSFSNSATLYQGIGFSLGASYLLGSAGRGPTLQMSPKLQTIYPLYYTYYDKNPLGTVRIENRSDSPIQKVRVSLKVPQFMDRPQLCAELAELGGDRSVEVPLTAIFTNAIFNITEGLKVAGEIVLDYDYLGSSKTVSEQVVLNVQNRNAMTWDDDRKAAAFMTTNHPLIKGYAKNLAATIRADGLQAFSNEFRIAMGVFTMLKDYGMQYIRDATTPFTELSENPDAVDQIQFPIESLNFKAGDCDDLSVLYGTLLEAAGVESAFITTPGHIFVAFNLNMPARKAESLFPDVTDMIETNDTMWLPIEVTLMGDGFVKAWQIGAQEWRSANQRGAAVFYTVHDAWKTYSPAETTFQAALFLPNPKEIIEPYHSELNRYIDRRLHELVASITDKIRERGASARLYNQLGVVYAKYGRLGEAESNFQKSVSLEQYAPAYINLGNVSYLRSEYQTAQRMYKRALNLSPENSLALLGYTKTSYELEQYKVVNDTLAKLEQVDSTAAESIAYMSTTSGAEVGRASAAADKEVWGWNE